MKRLHKWIAVALEWRSAYQRSNPDVGMGPSLDILLDRLFEQNGAVELTPEDRAAIIERVRRKERRV